MKQIILIPFILILLAADHTPTAPIGTPDSPPAPEQPTAEPTQSDGPYWAIGQLWAGLTAMDTGYCGGNMPEGDGARPVLTMTVDGAVNEARPFSIRHTGIDVIAELDAPVYSPIPGTVVWAGWSTWGLGNVVAVQYSGGWYALVAHLDSATVKCGWTVGTNTAVGTVGTSGNSNYPHTHIELRNGHYAYRPFQ